MPLLFKCSCLWEFSVIPSVNSLSTPLLCWPEARLLLTSSFLILSRSSWAHGHVHSSSYWQPNAVLSPALSPIPVTFFCLAESIDYAFHRFLIWLIYFLVSTISHFLQNLFPWWFVFNAVDEFLLSLIFLIHPLCCWRSSPGSGWNPSIFRSLVTLMFRSWWVLILFLKSHIALPLHVSYIILLQLCTLVGLYISCWEYKRMKCIGKAV